MQDHRQSTRNPSTGSIKLTMPTSMGLPRVRVAPKKFSALADELRTLVGSFEW